MVCCEISFLKAYKSPTGASLPESHFGASQRLSPPKRKFGLPSRDLNWSAFLLGLLPASEPAVPDPGTRTITLSLPKAVE